MKYFLIILVLVTNLVYGQQENDVKVYKSSWYFAAAALYPRYMTITDKSIASHENFGLSFSLGYNVTEHIGFRLTPNYVRLHSFYFGTNKEEIDNYLNMGTINFEAIYNILPCELISPFLLLGYGITYFKSTNPYLGTEIRETSIKNSFAGYQAEFGVGAEFKYWDNISLKVGVDYVIASNNKIDGNEHVNEVKGILQSNGDSYMNLSAGVNWYFSRGEKSNICEPIIGIKEIIKEVPVEVEKIIVDTVYVDNIIERAIIKREPFVLEKVKFKFDEDILTREAEIILDNVAKVLKKYPEEEIGIVGHTDNFGTDKYNMDLSKRRAVSVKNYLIASGINSARLFTSGCGERLPIADNAQAEGRAINRRIEFNIYEGISAGCE